MFPEIWRIWVRQDVHDYLCCQGKGFLHCPTQSLIAHVIFKPYPCRCSSPLMIQRSRLNLSFISSSLKTSSLSPCVISDIVTSQKIFVPVFLHNSLFKPVLGLGITVIEPPTFADDPKSKGGRSLVQQYHIYTLSPQSIGNCPADSCILLRRKLLCKQGHVHI